MWWKIYITIFTYEISLPVLYTCFPHYAHDKCKTSIDKVRLYTKKAPTFSSKNSTKKIINKKHMIHLKYKMWIKLNLGSCANLHTELLVRCDGSNNRICINDCFLWTKFIFFFFFFVWRLMDGCKIENFLVIYCIVCSFSSPDF